MPPMDMVDSENLFRKQMVLGHTLDTPGMILHAYRITILVIEYDLGEALCFDILTPLSRVLGLHNDHIAAITALLK